MKKLYSVSGTLQAEFCMEVEAISEDAAQALVEEVFTLEQFLLGTLIVEEASVEEVYEKSVQ